jgi:hypothetical protein
VVATRKGGFVSCARAFQTARRSCGREESRSRGREAQKRGLGRAARRDARGRRRFCVVRRVRRGGGASRFSGGTRETKPELERGDSNAVRDPKGALFYRIAS